MWRYLAWTVGALIAAMVIYQLFGRDPVEPQDQETIIRNEPDIHATEVLFTQMRADGTLHYRLRAETVAQFDSEDLTRLTKPDLHLLNPGRMYQEI